MESVNAWVYAECWKVNLALIKEVVPQNLLVTFELGARQIQLISSTWIFRSHLTRPLTENY